MQSSDESALLRQYVDDHSDVAFAALVTRHINLVYSVALRHTGEPDQAEEITQGVFILLANKAGQLRHDNALSSWLFQATRLTASNVVRSETRRHRREQEAHMQAVLDESGSDIWQQIAPLLDAAVASLSEKDRQAIVLRFYEGRNLREVGAALGASEDAAEKRVSRAVERLREFFAKRGITVGASGLVAVITANAVQAAPVGLAVTISTAAALAGTTLATTATATATKAIAMTTLQKTLVAVVFVAAVGGGIYEARQVQTLRKQQVPLTEEIQQLQSERNDATNRLALLAGENERLIRNTAELLKLRAEATRLRGEVGLLRRQIAGTKTTQEGATNQIQFTGPYRPYLRREEWSDNGTDKPVNTILTMLWAMRQGDETKLEQLVSRANASQQLDDLTFPKRDWEKLAGVQIVRSVWFRIAIPGGRMEDQATVETIVEQAPTSVGEDKGVEVHSWSLKKTNDQWLITWRH